MIILCYSIADPESLRSLTTRWKNVVEKHFNYDEQLPVAVLGLKRDIRNREDYDGQVRAGAQRGRDVDRELLNPRTFVYPQEALRIAQEMRCDRYCECSAVTGEVSDVSFSKTRCRSERSSGGMEESFNTVQALTLGSSVRKRSKI